MRHWILASASKLSFHPDRWPAPIRKSTLDHPISDPCPPVDSGAGHAHRDRDWPGGGKLKRILELFPAAVEPKVA